MKCKHHPSVPAIGVCAQCVVPICGICSRYQDDDLLCERCEDARSLAKQVEARSSQQSKAMAELLSRGKSEVRFEDNSRGDSKNKSARTEKFQMGIVGGCSVFIVFQIATSLASNRSLTTDQIQAEELTRSGIENCMLVFWDIAMGFSEGQDAPPNPRCPDSGTVLTVSQEAGDVIVSHPAPASLGVTAIYVTRSNPVPILVE